MPSDESRDLTPRPPEGSAEATELARQVLETAEAKREGQADDRRASGRRLRVWRRFLLLSAVLAAALIVPQYVIGPGGEALEVLPAELIGTWVTDDPRYVDRNVTIRAGDLTLGAGNEGSTTYLIRSVRVDVTVGHRAYEITYSGVEGDQVMEVLIYDDGHLQLRNPPEVIWTRAEN